MYLRKSLNSLQLLVNRQKTPNWCQIVANRRYLSDDNNKNDEFEDKSIEKVDQKKRVDSRRSEESVVIAKQHLNELIDNLKTKKIFGESDPKLKELLAKPKFHIRRSARNEPEVDKNDENINEISDKIDERLVLAAKGIASTLSGEQSKKTESDLLKLLKFQVFETNLAKEGKPLTKKDLTALLGDMKVVKEDPSEDKSFEALEFTATKAFDPKVQRFSDTEISGDFQARGKRKPYEDKFYEKSVTHSMLKRRSESQYKGESVNLFAGEDIGIFDRDMKDIPESENIPVMYIWDRLAADELQFMIAQPPQNAFEEMIQWTEEGKLWKFPINNEQGLEEEENVPFYEHVLLDHLLEGFPQTGPVRRFMELVILGLSSNPYITVERKHATVEYYRQYFKEREDILQIAGALG